MNPYPRTPQERKELAEKYRQYKLRCEGCISIFLKEKPGYVYDPDGSVTSQALYASFKAWCLKEGLPVRPAREFWLHAKKYDFEYGMVYSSHILNAEGKFVRGFHGLRQTYNTVETAKQ